MRFSVIIPVYNEEGNITRVLSEIRESFAGIGGGYEVVIVDDGSSDGTVNSIRELINGESNARLVRLDRHYGKGIALTAGISRANADVIVTMDGDGQDDPADVMKLVGAVESGCDIATGNRVKRADVWSKTALSKTYNSLVRFFFGVRLHDNNCPLKAFRKASVEGICLDYDLYRFMNPIAHVRGLRLSELNVTNRPRTCGNSKYGLRRVVSGVLTIPAAYVIAYRRIAVRCRPYGIMD